MAPVQVVFAGVGSAVRSGLLETQVRPLSAAVARTVTENGTAWLGSTVAGSAEEIALNERGGLPMPLKETVRPGATVSVPLDTATDVGANTTEMVQLAAGVVQVVPATPNTVTSTFGLSATRAPVLVMVTANVGLICPTSTSEKLSAAG